MLGKVLALVPKFLVRPIANTYIAGETTAECIARGGALNAEGWRLIIDVLGEHSTADQATAAVEHYIELMAEATAAGLNFGLSAKLSHLGSTLSGNLAKTNLKRILEHARKADLHLTIDMESTATTDATLAIYGELLDDHDLGCVVQAYLRRSRDDLDVLLSNHDPGRVRMRVCKGIYVEPRELVLPTPNDIRDNFINLAETLYDAGAYVCVATHDVELITHFENAGWEPGRFEFQVLLGVPVQEHMQRLRGKGFTTTVYVPFGPEWHAYSMRRLSENPKLLRYVLGNLFSRQ